MMTVKRMRFSKRKSKRIFMTKAASILDGESRFEFSYLKVLYQCPCFDLSLSVYCAIHAPGYSVHFQPICFDCHLPLFVIHHRRFLEYRNSSTAPFCKVRHTDSRTTTRHSMCFNAPIHREIMSFYYAPVHLSEFENALTGRRSLTHIFFQ